MIAAIARAANVKKAAPGPAMMIGTAKIAAMTLAGGLLDRITEATATAIVRLTVNAVAMHEYAHAIDFEARGVELLPPLDEHLGLEQRVKRSVTPIFLTDSATVLPRPTSTSTSRSLGMICSASSFFPRGMECPPLVLTPPDSLSGSGAV